MNPDITSYMNTHRQEMFSLLEELVIIQSGSRNKKGVDQVGKRIALEMEAMGFSCEFQGETEYGNNLIVRTWDPGLENDPKKNQDKNQILITGHMDTVFPEDTAFNYYREGKTRCYGPGVADMKGGLVVGIFALKALYHNGLINKNQPNKNQPNKNRTDKKPICFIFNSDEEIGSPSSRKLIQKEAQKSRIAYVLEAGGLSGELVTGRKGNMSLRLMVEGRAGHAAFAGKDKASAILELAHKTIALEAMNNPEKGISANVGTIEGGMGPNTVAAQAKAAIDFRYINDRDSEILKTQIKAIVSNQTIANTHASIHTASSRPAMPQTHANICLFKKIQALAIELDIAVVSELRQGVSDANIIAREGVPVIDGLGPIGAKDHSEDEYIEKSSLYERAVLFGNVLACT
jgi:glutamate carboxypeptidase